MPATFEMEKNLEKKKHTVLKIQFFFIKIYKEKKNNEKIRIFEYVPPNLLFVIGIVEFDEYFWKP